MRLVATVLPTVWVVDSNCFIHLGNHGDNKAIKDISAACKQMGATLHVTPGVHKEVATVSMQKWNNKPRLLDVMAEILTTTSVTDDQIRGLAQRIGEQASPQDVDLSLMILAARYHQDGKEVTLVTDDFKMTTTKEKAGFGFETCPPSTFLFKLSINLFIVVNCSNPAAERTEQTPDRCERRECMEAFESTEIARRRPPLVNGAARRVAAFAF
jgi:rRNA maturation endonuclease Nob1